MSDLEEKCGNIRSLKGFNIHSLCNTCQHDQACGYQLASDTIAKFNKIPGVRQEHIIKVCFLYKKYDTSLLDPEHAKLFPNEKGNLSPRLWEAIVEDRCAVCPSEVKTECARRDGLDQLSSAAQLAGTWVEAMVVCCDQSERLYQISEPKRSP